MEATHNRDHELDVSSLDDWENLDGDRLTAFYEGVV